MDRYRSVIITVTVGYMADFVVRTQRVDQAGESWLTIRARRADGAVFETRVQVSKLRVLRIGSSEINRLVSLLLGEPNA